MESDMPEDASPRAPLSRFALWVAIGAALLGIALEAIRAAAEQSVRSEAICAGLIILVIGLVQLAKGRARTP
jgi:sulfite exporter TauE/SafE